MIWRDFVGLGYAVLALNSAANLALMRKVRPRSSPDPNVVEKVSVLIPARDESETLPRLLKSLREPYPNLRVYVFDDESTDGTAEIAKSFGAVVISPREPLPEDWTGKNRACHELAQAAIEDFEGNYILFLDADTEVHPGLLEGLIEAVESKNRPVGVASGMPRLFHGRFPEPLFLAWVPWILLSTNPFWLVDRTGIGHNYFTNGQVVLWKKAVYTEVWPHSTLRGAVLEDARIGRLLARKRIKISVLDLSNVLVTYMYKNYQECFDGLSKNSFEIMGNHPMTWLFSILLLAIAWAWLGFGPGQIQLVALGFLLLSGFFSARGTKSPLYLGLLTPLTITIGAATALRSSWWRYKKRVIWKGRNYGNRNG